MSETQDISVTRIECPAAKDPVVRRLIIGLMLVGFAAYTVYDHYILGNYQDGGDFNVHLKYLFNHFLPFVLTPPGLIILGWGLVHNGRRLVADQTGIGYDGKPQIAWSDVTNVDARLLAEKGYLVLEYGQGKRFKLDSYCFKNFRDLVAFMERHMPAERIRR